MSHRIPKVNELIKQELGKIIFLNEDFGPGVLVTVLDVKTSADLLHSNVIFSVFPTQKGQLVLKKLQAHIGGLQQSLNRILRMRPVPKINFVFNNDETASQRIDELLEEIKRQEEQKEYD